MGIRDITFPPMPQAKTVSDPELKRVLAMLSTHRHATRNRLIVLMSFYVGLRVGEIAALKRTNVLNDDGTIKDEVWLAADQTKGCRGRAVYLSKKMIRELELYVKENKLARTDDPFFISQRTRKGFSANALCQLMKSWYQAAGIADARSHSGRRTFITALANKGVGVRTLMALAGHRHMSTTQRYIDLSVDQQKSAVNLL